MNKNIKDNIKVDSDLEFYKEKIPSFQLNLIKEYFDVDEENKIINLNINVDKISEILDFSYGKKPSINSDFFEKILSLITCFPKKYKIIIMVAANNLEGYNENILKDILIGSIKFNFIKSNLSVKRKNVISIIFLLIGIILMLLNIILLKGNIFTITSNNQVWVDILSEVLDISSWVFVWEAVTIYFLEKIENRGKILLLKNKILDIKFIKKDN